MKLKHLFIILTILFNSSFCKPDKTPLKLTGIVLLEKSIEYHDPGGNWSNSSISVHIQEPRIGNPSRYSILQIDNEREYFALTRATDEGDAKRVVEKNTARVFLNGTKDIPLNMVEELRLSPEANFGYQRFYRLMYGLPMSLLEDEIKEVKDPVRTSFLAKDVFEVEVILNEAMISDTWVLYIDTSNFQLLGLRLLHEAEDNEDEQIIFDGAYEFDGITIPRFRHWSRIQSKEYRGSDIILKATSEM